MHALAVGDESVERGARMREVGSSIPGRVRSMTNQIDICLFLAWLSALMNWFVQCQYNLLEWDAGSWHQQPDFPVRQHYKVAMSVCCHNSVGILI